MRWNTVEQSPVRWMDLAGALLLALILIGAVDIFTNTLDTTVFEGDFIYYIDMVEHGVLDNPHLAAPFAYRPLTPFLAGSLADLTGASLETGFQLVAWAGALLTLMGTYGLARTVGAGHRYALVVMLIIAFSFYHLKYLLFDVYRTDHLAYGLLILAFLALMHERWVACVSVSAVGMLTREFCIIPLVLLGVQQLLKLRQGQDSKSLILLRVVIIGLVSAGLVLLPRLLLPVETTFVYATLFKPEPTAWETITLPLTSFRRNLNIVFALIAYSLPLIWLGGWAQWRAVWRGLGDLRWMVGGYTLLVLLLTLIGGTDVARFVTYLHIPLIIFAARRLTPDTPGLLMVGLLISLIIFNRIPFLIPQDDYNRFIDYYGAYHDRVNATVIARWQELVIFVFVAVGLRGGLAIAAKNKQASPE